MTQNFFSPQKNMATIIHLGFMLSVVVYMAVVWVVGPGLVTSGSGDIPEEGGNLRYVFFGIAVILILAVRRLPRLFGPREDQPEEIKKVRLLRASIVTSAICELPALLGLVLFSLTGIKRDFYYLTGLSLILFILYFPRATLWESTE